MKSMFTRDSFKPENSIEIKAADCSAVAYLGTSKTGSGKIVACGFSGKRNKPDFNYSFRDEQQARAHIAQHADGVKRSESFRAERKAKYQADKSHSVLDVWSKAQRGETLTASDVAICLRAQLAVKFPGVKFSVRSDRGLNVYWTDGPTSKEVDALSKNYSFEGFDGMIDMRYNVDRWLSRDGLMSLAHTGGTQGSAGVCDEVIGDPHSADAVQCSSYCDFVFTHREISPEIKQGLARKVCDKFGIEMPSSFPDDTAFERFLNTTRDKHDNYLANLVWRASNGEL